MVVIDSALVACWVVETWACKFLPPGVRAVLKTVVVDGWRRSTDRLVVASSAQSSEEHSEEEPDS